jgi:hypothetical protein
VGRGAGDHRRARERAIEEAARRLRYGWQFSKVILQTWLR